MALFLIPAFAQAQTAPQSAPPSGGGFFPLSEVRAGLTGTAWTVFTGATPEPMQVEILGVLRGARGPGHDMILAQLHGAKPEYTGVVAGMSGSPVYIGNRLLGSLSYRLGQFTKDPIAGITPIEQMLEVRDLPDDSGQWSVASDPLPQPLDRQSMQAPIQKMETPLVMSGFHPEAIRLWQQKMAGTGLETVSAGGSSEPSGNNATSDAAISPQAIASIRPGSAVSAQLVRGDFEIAATCTVTYVDPKQLLACGHPILQAGSVSLPMTTAEVVATVASPFNAFKIVNTGQTIGAFTEDRDAAIRGIFGAQAHMIPVHFRIRGPLNSAPRQLNVEVLDMPSLTPQAVLVTLYESLLESNDSTAQSSYHITGGIDLAGYPPSPIDLWAAAGESLPAPMIAALETGGQFARIYSNGSRTNSVRAVNLDVEVIPHHIDVELKAAQIVSGNIVHAGDTVLVEATLQPWHQPARNLRIAVKLPARLQEGNLRLLVSDAGTLDRTLDQPRQPNHSPDLESELSQARRHHPSDRIYVSLLMPETQASLAGQTLSSLPLSVANTLEPLRAAQDASLNGESVQLAADAAADGVLSGFQLLTLRIEPGGGLN
ncbi:MAG: SpoIVB peptidase S55 [Terracidiphilus sp.]|jgi:hypothetical protein